MARREAKQVYERAWLALTLAWIAGTVDAIGYLMLAHLFTAHMSGNTAAMGAELGTGKWTEAWHRALPIPNFVAGVAGGSALAEIAKRRQIRSVFSLVLGVQALLLTAFLIWANQHLSNGIAQPEGRWVYSLPVALLALAMGLQNSTLRRVGNQNVRTTYVSGMLTDFAEQSVAFLFWLKDHLRAGPSGRRVWRVVSRQPTLRRGVLFIGIWWAFVLGAVMGGAAIQRWGVRALLLPMCGLGAVIIVDWVWPVSPQQDKPGCTLKRGHARRDGRLRGIEAHEERRGAQ